MHYALSTSKEDCFNDVPFFEGETLFAINEKTTALKMNEGARKLADPTNFLSQRPL